MEKSMKKEVKNEKGLLKVDELGRITIELKRRERHGIKEKDKVEIYIENNSIILRKLDILVEKEEIAKSKCTINGDIEINVQVNKIKETILNINDIGHYIRRVDEFGRIVLPIELRQKLGILPNNVLKAEDIENNISLIKKERFRKYGKRHSSYHSKKQGQHCQRY